MLLRMRVGAFDFNFFSSNQVKLEAALTLMTGDSLGSCRTETEIVWGFSSVVFSFYFWQYHASFLRNQLSELVLYRRYLLLYERAR